MPPKKQEQQNSNPYIPFYVLPIFLKDSLEESNAQRILRSKPINIKKCIDKSKILEILKDKGLSQHLSSDSQIKTEGRKFICQNIKTVLHEFIAQVTKPVDTKKDAGKKDSKKEGKKQEIAVDVNKDPMVQLSFEKKCNDFHFYFDILADANQLRTCVQNGIKIDVVVVIEEKVKKGSNLPDYNLLGKTYKPSELLENMNETKIQQDSKKSKVSQQFQKNTGGKQLIRQLRKLKHQNPAFSHLLITSIPFEKNISHPESNQSDFINNLFDKLCEITRLKQNYENWIKNSVKPTPMIEPLKEVIRKEVPIEVQDKKGKKDVNKQPEFTTVQEVIQTKYESLPENVKSNLNHYRQVQSLRANSAENKNPLRAILQNCLVSIQLQLGKQSSLSQNSQINPQKSIDKFKSKPLIKDSCIQSLKQNLRAVQSFHKEQMTHNLINKIQQIQEKINLSDILHDDPKRKQILEFQFIIRTFTEFMQTQQPRIKMNFMDRVYRQKLTKNQVLSTIQNQLLQDPKIYEGILKKDNIKLLCLAKINSPGRVLYLNNLFEAKAVPNFENWVNLFRNKSVDQKSDEFYDYKFQDTGNLSIRKQIFTPSDNVIISDQKITIGSEIMKVNHFSKNDTVYGIKKIDNETNEFWTYNSKDKISLRAFQKQHQFKSTKKITQKIKIEGSEQEQKVEKIIQSIQNQKRLQIWLRTEHFVVSHTPYPSITWLNSNKKNLYEQIRRDFGAKGQITSYLNDGTIKVFYLNGSVSTFKNNRWEKVINDDLIVSNQSSKKLGIRQFTQGDKTIKIREDQTVFIEFSNGNSLTTFCDGTKVLFKRNQNSYEIKSSNTQLKEEIIVRIKMPRNNDFNVIGHGSAYAYLGFKNLVERSYDGFVYQFWHNKFSTHLYNEKYEFQNKMYEQEIRLVYLQDGSLIKMEGQQHITYIQGDYENSEDKLRSKWNQAFSIEQSHQAGVYDVHLREGTIQTKDAQSNSFKIHVEQENQINIAVSFKINEQDKVTNDFGNGFHVPEENFFLPAPTNSLPPRIFSFDNQSRQYYEYLTEQQIRQMEVSSSSYRVEESSLDNKTVKQYTRQLTHKERFEDQRKIVTFSAIPSNQQFELPSILVPKQTRVNMNVENDRVQFRMIEKIDWNRDFSNINKIQEKILKRKQERQNELKSFSN